MKSINQCDRTLFDDVDSVTKRRTTTYEHSPSIYYELPWDEEAASQETLLALSIR